MQQQLQEFDFNVVHRAGAKHGNADGLSRMLEEGPDWMPGEKEKAFGSCPEPMPLDLALQKAKQHQVETVTMISETQEEDEEETITWERTPSEISTLQKEDDAMSQVFYWAELEGDAGDMPSLGTNLIPKEQAIQYGPEALAYWSRWNELSIRGGCSIKNGSQGMTCVRYCRSLFLQPGGRRSSTSCTPRRLAADTLQLRRPSLEFVNGSGGPS